MYERKIIPAFVRVHILYHASKGGVYGMAMIKELRTHGYDISPGTLYPMLHEMESGGLLKSSVEKVNGRFRRVYRATEKGEDVLDKMRYFIGELAREVLE